MKKQRVIRCLGLAVGMALLGYSWMSGDLRYAWCSISGTPLIEFPGVVDLGEQEFGVAAKARFTIANTGGGELVIDEIRHQCSCTGIEQERDGTLHALNSVRIPPGAKADLVMRFTVRDVPIGAKAAQPIDFRTNDPICSSGRIVAFVRRVTGGVTTWPTRFSFGVVPVGTNSRQSFVIDDNAVEPRKLESVTTDKGALFAINLLSPGEALSGDSKLKEQRIGRFEVVVDTTKPGIVDGLVSVNVAGGKVKTVPVVGRVAAPVEFSPGAIVLPRLSSSGPIYTFDAVCQSIVGAPLALEVDSLPAGITVKSISQPLPSMQVVRVTIDPSARTSTDKWQRELVPIRAKAGQFQGHVELPIFRQL